MLLTAWPEIDDQQSGALFSGAAGQLLDAMLRAIGMARADCYTASLAVTRPAGGRCDGEEAAELDRLLWHHLRLAKPERLLLIGSDITRMAAATALPDARGRLLNINQRSEEHPSALQSLMRISYAVLCLKKKTI